MELTKKTDLEIALDKLEELAPNITPEDKKNSEWSAESISKYLNHNGRSIGTAIKMLTYFRKQIRLRRSVLNEE